MTSPLYFPVFPALLRRFRTPGGIDEGRVINDCPPPNRSRATLAVLGAILDDDRCCSGFCETTGPDRGGYRGAVGKTAVGRAVARRDRAAEAADGGDALFKPRRRQTPPA